MPAVPSRSHLSPGRRGGSGGNGFQYRSTCARGSPVTGQDKCAFRALIIFGHVVVALAPRLARCAASARPSSRCTACPARSALGSYVKFIGCEQWRRLMHTAKKERQCKKYYRRFLRFCVKRVFIYSWRQQGNNATFRGEKAKARPLPIAVPENVYKVSNCAPNPVPLARVRACARGHLNGRC